MKNILLNIHDDDAQSGRLAVALDVARQTGGHLTCVQVTPVEAYAADPYGGMFGMAALIDTIHDQDKALRLAIEARLNSSGVPWDWRSYDGNPVETLIDQSSLADLVVLSQPSTQQRRGLRQPQAIVGDVVMYTRCPVLMVPHGVEQLDLAGQVVVAWNGSAEAAHALRLALPLLKRAGAVHLVEVSDDVPGLAAREAAQWLSRHGIAADVHEWPAKGRRVSVALLHAAAELSARYMVMGAYGHSRLRETVLGGVTRELIASANLPLLLAH
ncbi:universal stress protein [Sandarakinorhabdus sp. AAP62]|uniref:universal stress protein n=1 Tax=Sandarakinorhabdus sp. AAP62 TaxID=1248916 RepID=UPI00030B56B4|nr:universal stress protein [Sandarakinorhabdus sp. AAP62]